MLTPAEEDDVLDRLRAAERPVAVLTLLAFFSVSSAVAVIGLIVLARTVGD